MSCTACFILEDSSATLFIYFLSIILNLKVEFRAGAKHWWWIMDWVSSKYWSFGRYHNIVVFDQIYECETWAFGRKFWYNLRLGFLWTFSICSTIKHWKNSFFGWEFWSMSLWPLKSFFSLVVNNLLETFEGWALLFISAQESLCKIYFSFKVTRNKPI